MENGTFYTDYINKKIKRGEDVTSTKEFIKKMDDIAAVIKVFLDKYSDANKINLAIIDFRRELQDIIDTLNLRIETEEDGVFEFYLLM